MDELKVITIPNRDGPPIVLKPGIQVWREIEAQYGDAGLLFQRYRDARPHVSFYHDLLFKCARAGGSDESYAAFGARLYAVGFYTVFKTVGEIFAELFKEPEQPAELAEPGGKPDPLA